MRQLNYTIIQLIQQGYLIHRQPLYTRIYWTHSWTLRSTRRYLSGNWYLSGSCSNIDQPVLSLTWTGLEIKALSQCLSVNVLMTGRCPISTGQTPTWPGTQTTIPACRTCASPLTRSGPRTSCCTTGQRVFLGREVVQIWWSFGFECTATNLFVDFRCK